MGGTNMKKGGSKGPKIKADDTDDYAAAKSDDSHSRKDPKEEDTDSDTPGLDEFTPGSTQTIKRKVVPLSQAEESQRGQSSLPPRKNASRILP